MNIVEVKNIYYKISATKILTDISLNVSKGDFLAILGQNGSGKTTLLRLILGLISPTSGVIKLFGKRLEEFNEWHKIGYVPQKAVNFDQSFPATVEEIVSMGLLSKKRFPKIINKKDKERIKKSLKDVEMYDFRDRRIGDLSGGQQQRVFIAKAIVGQPEVLFLDEPTTGIDNLTQKRFYDLLNKLNKEKNITIILITHDIATVTNYINKVAFLSGKIVFYGTHKDFCRSEEVFKYLGEDKHFLCTPDKI